MPPMAARTGRPLPHNVSRATRCAAARHRVGPRIAGFFVRWPLLHACEAEPEHRESRIARASSPRIPRTASATREPARSLRIVRTFRSGRQDTDRHCTRARIHDRSRPSAIPLLPASVPRCLHRAGTPAQFSVPPARRKAARAPRGARTPADRGHALLNQPNDEYPKKALHVRTANRMP